MIFIHAFSLRIKLDRDFSQERGEQQKNTYKTTGRQYGKATITENRCHLRIYDIENEKGKREEMAIENDIV